MARPPGVIRCPRWFTVHVNATPLQQEKYQYKVCALPSCSHRVKASSSRGSEADVGGWRIPHCGAHDDDSEDEKEWNGMNLGEEERK